MNSIASLRPYSWAKYWSQQGHDVTVITTQKSTTSTDLQLPLTGFRTIEIPMPNAFQLLKRSYQTPPKTEPQPSAAPKSPLKKSLLKQAIHSFRQSTGIFNACRYPDLTHLWISPAWKALAKEGSWDLVISTCGPYPVHLLAYKLKKKRLAAKWIADYRDLWVGNHFYPGIWPFISLEKYLEKKISLTADLMTTVSTPLASQLQQRYPHASVAVVENGFDPCDLSDLSLECVFPNDGKCRIVYTGSIYSTQNPEPLFQAIQLLSASSDSHLLDRLEVIFTGNTRSLIDPLINQYKVSPWVVHQGKTSRETSLRMQRDAHFLLFLPHAGEEGILSGKLFEYLYSRTPMICLGASDLNDVQKLIISQNVGESLGSNINMISSFLKKQLQSNVPRTRVNPDPHFLSSFSRQHLAQSLLDLIIK